MLKPIAEYIMQKAAEGANLVNLCFDEDTRRDCKTGKIIKVKLDCDQSQEILARVIGCENGPVSQQPTAVPLSEIYLRFSQDLFGYPSGNKAIETLNPKFGLAQLLPYVTRDLVKFFKALEPWYKAFIKNKKNISPASPEEIETTLEALVQIFNAALYNGDITPNDLLLLKRGRHLGWLCSYCLNTRLSVEQFWRLYPLYDDESWNQRSLILQAFLFQGWKAQSKGSSRDSVEQSASVACSATDGQDASASKGSVLRGKSKRKSKTSNEQNNELMYPHGPMSFAIKVLLPCWVAASQDLVGKEIAKLKRLLSVGNTERHVYMAIRGLAYKLHDDQKNLSNYGQGYVKVDDLKHIISWEKPLGWFCFRMYRPNRGLESYADILLALARLVDVLKEGSSFNVHINHMSQEKDHEKQEEQERKELINLFNLFIQDRVWYLHLDSKNKTSNCKFINDVKEFKNGSEFVKLMLMWLKGMKMLQPTQLLPPPIIARTWVRFMNNLDYIRADIDIETEACKSREEKLEILEMGLQEKIKCWIMAFLGALLIEEVIFKRGDLEHSIAVEQIHLKAEGFKKILNDLIVSDGFTPELICYTKSWISCPLFLEFISDDINAIVKKKLFGSDTQWFEIIKHYSP
jgi:hypothetical protein